MTNADLVKRVRDDVMQMLDECLDHADWFYDATNGELDAVCAFLRRFDVAQLRGCPAPTLAELIRMLERGEHRRP